MVGNLVKKNSKSIRGFNLIEIAIVLAVIGVIVGGVYVAASSVYENNRKQTAQTQLLNIVNNIRQLHSGQSSIDTAFNTASAINANAVPADMVSGTTANSPYGSVVIAAPSTSTFSVQFQDLSKSSCIEMVSRIAGSSISATSMGVTSITVASSNYTTAGGTIPITVTTLTSACSATATANDVTMVFNIRT